MKCPFLSLFVTALLLVTSLQIASAQAYYVELINRGLSVRCVRN